MTHLKHYKLKCVNEDFQVNEVSLMPNLTSQKPHRFTYIWVQKSGFTTFDILEQLKIFFKLSFEDVASQGLKDEDAVTEQLISVKEILKDKDVIAFNKKYKSRKNFVIIKHIVGYGNEAIKERMLHGNSFRIVVRNLDNTTAENLLGYISNHRHHYFINYYDNQRFGMPGGPYNTHLIGKAIVKNNWKEAYRHIKDSKNTLPDSATEKNITDFKAVFKSMNPKKVSFFVSSYNSFLWNKQASLIIKKHTRSKKYAFENVGNLHIPTTHSFLCPSICDAGGHEFIAQEFTTKDKKNSKNIIVATTIYAHDLEKDELHRNKKKLTLSFFLPTGSYATMIIKQIFLRLNK